MLCTLLKMKSSQGQVKWPPKVSSLPFSPSAQRMSIKSCINIIYENLARYGSFILNYQVFLGGIKLDYAWKVILSEFASKKRALLGLVSYNDPLI